MLPNLTPRSNSSHYLSGNHGSNALEVSGMWMIIVFLRKERTVVRTEVCPLGSGAVT